MGTDFRLSETAEIGHYHWIDGMLDQFTWMVSFT